jgi:dienelactone hydrolase
LLGASYEPGDERRYPACGSTNWSRAFFCRFERNRARTRIAERRQEMIRPARTAGLLMLVVLLMLPSTAALGRPPRQPRPPVDVTEVVYRTVDGRDLHAVVYPASPTSDPGRAMAWFWFSKFQYSTRYYKTSEQAKLQTFAAEGFTTFSIEVRTWREVPGAVFPAAEEDAIAFLRWLRDNAAAYGVDPARISVGGGSGGGYLALQVANKHPSDVDVAAAAAPSPPTDFTADIGPDDVQNNYLGCDPSAGGTVCLRRAAEASPLHNLTPEDPPQYAAWSEDEIVNDETQGEPYITRLQGLGIPHEALIAPGTAHAFKLWTKVNAPMKAFLKAHS